MTLLATSMTLCISEFAHSSSMVTTTTMDAQLRLGFRFGLSMMRILPFGGIPPIDKTALSQLIDDIVGTLERLCILLSSFSTLSDG